MSDLVSRLVRVFVLPADEVGAAARPAERPAAAAEPAVAMLLCSPRDAVPLACAAALELRSAARAPAALTCVWSGEAGADGRRGAPADAEPPPDRIALPAARRLAARLRSRGLDAVAAGRLAVVHLPADGAAATAGAYDAIAAARVPAAVALAGPRCDATDRLLLAADAVSIVAAGDSAIAELATASLPVAAERIAVRPGPLARALAQTGLAVTPRLHRDLKGRPR
jgi:hypothetical protein